MLDPNYLCPGCMKVRDTVEGACPHCGFDEKNYINTVSARVLLPGTILAGKYLLGRVLGEGGFGITYLGWDLNQEIPLAIKEYFPVNLATRDTLDGKTEKLSVISGDKKRYYEYGLKSFQEEAQNLSRFRQIPGVVSVKDFFFENATAYLVMEYLEGQNLKQYLSQKQGKCISEEETLQIMRPIIEALAVVHNTGIIHRDISPENIILTNDGKVKLIDFGAARVATGAETQSLTVLLKHGYAPVEQYQTRGKQGTWTDIYALCATMYRMLSGKTPEPSIDRMLDDKVESLFAISQKNPGIKVSKQTSDVIERGLSVKAEQRWQKVEYLQRALWYMPQNEPGGQNVSENQNISGNQKPSENQKTFPTEKPSGGAGGYNLQRKDSSDNRNKSNRAVIIGVVSCLLVFILMLGYVTTLGAASVFSDNGNYMDDNDDSEGLRTSNDIREDTENDAGEEKPEEEVIKQQEVTPTFSLVEINRDTMNELNRVHVTSAAASSQINQKGYDNSPIRAFDGDEESNWEEGVDGTGIGQNLVGYFDREYKVKYIFLKLGNWRTRDNKGTVKDYYSMNCRPRTLTITLNGLSQQFTFPGIKKEYCICLNQGYPASSIDIRIDDVYTGKYSDCVISDIAVYHE